MSGSSQRLDLPPMHSLSTMRQFVRDIGSLWSSAFTPLLTLEHQRQFDHPVEDDDILEKKICAGVLVLYQRLRIGFDFLGMAQTHAELQAGFKKFEENPPAIDEDEYGDLRSGSLEFLRPYVKALESLFPPDSGHAPEEIKRDFLERVLKNTLKILRDRGLEPRKEVEVYKAIASVLETLFPDLTSSVTLAKPLKCYKPDFGIPELRAAVEFKFADSEQETKTAMDGIFADMHGYAGSREWTTFYAVIYMTDHFFTQEQVEAHLKLSDSQQTWKVLPVYGKGGRAKLPVVAPMSQKKPT
jgi:hypothetical protein